MNTPDTCPYCHAIISDTGHFCPGPDQESVSWSKTKLESPTTPTTKEFVEKLETFLPHCAGELKETLRATIAELKRGEEARAFLVWLLANCKVIHWPGGGHYPIEHAPAANKDSVLFLKMAMNKKGMYARPLTGGPATPDAPEREWACNRCMYSWDGNAGHCPVCGHEATHGKAFAMSSTAAKEGEG
jgi:rubrerythrin